MVLNLKSPFLTIHFKTKFDQVVSLFFILCKQTHFPIERQVFFCSVGRQPGAFIHKQMWIKSDGDRATARTNIFQKHIVLWENAFSVKVWQVGGHGPLPPTCIYKKIRICHDTGNSNILPFAGKVHITSWDSYLISWSEGKMGGFHLPRHVFDNIFMITYPYVPVFLRA